MGLSKEELEKLEEAYDDLSNSLQQISKDALSGLDPRHLSQMAELGRNAYPKFVFVYRGGRSPFVNLVLDYAKKHGYKPWDETEHSQAMDEYHLLRGRLY